GGLAQAVTLEADVAARERRRARRERELVAVPLKRGEARGERGGERIVCPLLGHLHLVPADLRPARTPRGRARRLGEQLGAEAHAERRHLACEQLAKQRLLLAEPGVP